MSVGAVRFSYVPRERFSNQGVKQFGIPVLKGDGRKKARNRMTPAGKSRNKSRKVGIKESVHEEVNKRYVKGKKKKKKRGTPANG